MTALSDCTAEIIRLHKVIELWTRGAISQTDEEFSNFADVLAPELYLINPDGVVEARDKVVTRFRNSHGARAGFGFSIKISDIIMRYDMGERYHVTYLEHWLLKGERDSTILSSALFGRQEGAPNRVVWLHLHETWAHSEEK